MGARPMTHWLQASVVAVGAMLSADFGQTAKNMTEMSHYIRPGTTSASAGIWGWTSPVTGKEYALMSSRTPGGLCVVDISNPSSPVLTVFIPAGHNSIWFEVSAHGNYAYMVSQEGTMGLMIVDLSPLNTGEAPKLVKSDVSLFKVAHTLFCDSAAKPARLYVTYGASAGLTILSLADPEKPAELGRLPGTSHDMYARGNRLYLCTQGKGLVDIRDVTDPAATTRLGVIDLQAKSRELGEIGATATTIAHNAWSSDDGKILFTTEEISSAYGKSWDISNPLAPKYLGRYTGASGVIAHNVYVKGNRLYVAHNGAGLRVVDVSDPANMQELGWHEPANNGNSWGAYPFFKSGYIIHGDDRLGLYVVREDFSAALGRRPGRPDRFAIREVGDGAVGFRLPGTGAYVLSIYTPSGRKVLSRRGRWEASWQSLSLGGSAAVGGYVVKLSGTPGADAFTRSLVLGGR